MRGHNPVSEAGGGENRRLVNGRSPPIAKVQKNAEHSIRSSSAMGGRAKKLAGVRETSYSIFACQEGLPSTSSSSAAAASASPS